MNDIVFFICYGVCLFLGVRVNFPEGVLSFPDGYYWNSSDLVQPGGWEDGSVANFHINYGSQGVLPQFCSAIVENPIVLFFVLMIAVFIGVKLLRRLCDV